MLSLDDQLDRIACVVGWIDRAGILFHPLHPALFCASAEGLDLPLDVCVLCRVYLGLRDDTLDGNLEHLARKLLALRFNQGHHGRSLSADSISAHEINPAGTGLAKSVGVTKGV